MLVYVCGMKTKSIPWDVVEGVLAEIKQDASWLRSKLDVGANVITNWKTRGVPKNRADELASILGTSADFLLQRPGAARHGSARPTSSDLERGIELLAIFSRCDFVDQERILENARATEQMNLLRTGRNAADKPKPRP